MTHELYTRVVADSADRDSWLAARVGKIGASDAASFAKASSIESYVRAKLMPNRFEGNGFTANGHAWEPTLTDFAHVTHNTKMFRSVAVPEFVATPDGLNITPSGRVVLSECKIKHKPVKGPTPAEFRQVFWAQSVCDAEATAFVWLTLDPDTNQPTTLEPSVLIIERDQAAIDRLLAIAHPVLDAMKRAAEFERENENV